MQIPDPQRVGALELLPNDRRRLVFRPCGDGNELLDSGQLVLAVRRSLVRQDLRSVEVERGIHQRVILMMKPHRSVRLMLDALRDITRVARRHGIVQRLEPGGCRTGSLDVSVNRFTEASRENAVAVQRASACHSGRKRTDEHCRSVQSASGLDANHVNAHW
jgi:hypothetical protein